MKLHAFIYRTLTKVSKSLSTFKAHVKSLFKLLLTIKNTVENAVLIPTGFFLLENQEMDFNKWLQ